MGKYPWKSKGFWGAMIVMLAAIITIIKGDTTNGIALVGIGLSLLGIREKQEKLEKRKK